MFRKGFYCLSLLFILTTEPSFGQTTTFDSKASFFINKKGGLISNKGKVIVKPFYDGVQSVYCDEYVWVKKNDKYGFIDQNGKVVIPIIYEDVYSFYSNLGRVTLNEKAGFISKKGEVVIPFNYGIWDIDRDKSNLVEGRILLQDSSLMIGYLDTTNTVVIPYSYEKGEVFLDGHAIVATYNDMSELKYGAIDKNNNVTIPFIYSTLRYQHDNLYFAYRFWTETKDSISFEYLNGMGVVDSNNHIIIPFEYDSIRPRVDFLYLKENTCSPLVFEKHLACFKFETGWSILDVKGNETTCCYEDMQTITSGYVAAKKGAWGLIDTLGNVKIPFDYDYVEIKKDGIVTVKKDKKWAYWKTDGTQLSDFVYDSLSEYREGLAIVRKDKKYYLIDIKGKVFLENIPLDYDHWTHHPVQGPNTLLFKKGKKYGLMDFKGKIVFPAKADEGILFERL